MRALGSRGSSIELERLGLAVADLAQDVDSNRPQARDSVGRGRVGLAEHVLDHLARLICALGPDQFADALVKLRSDEAALAGPRLTVRL